MNVFLSWSGEESHSVAMALREWLPCVIQSIRPYVSSEDIDKGARWSAEVAKELDEADFGIVCVTRSNLQAPWINFEAGALSRAIDKDNVCPFLFRVKESELNGPLLQFQYVTYSRAELFRLLTSLNKRLGQGSGLSEEYLKKTFDLWWPHLQMLLDAIPESEEQREPPNLLSTLQGKRHPVEGRQEKSKTFLHSVYESVYKLYHQQDDTESAAIVDEEIEILIDEYGNATCSDRQKLLVMTGIYSAELFGFLGEPPIEDFEDINLSVESNSSDQDIAFLPAYNMPGEKKCLVFFLPAVAEGKTADFTMRWQWPGMWGKLLRGQADKWEGKPRPTLRIRRVEIRLRVHPSLPQLELRNIGQGGGQLNHTPRVVDEGYIEYCWEMNSLRPGTRYVLRLRPMVEFT